MQRALGLLVLVGVNLAIAFGIWGWTPLRGRSDETQLAYGLPVPEIAKRVREVTAPGSHVSLLFVNKDVVARLRARVVYATSIDAILSGPSWTTVLVSAGPVQGLGALPPSVKHLEDPDGSIFRAAHISPNHSHGGVLVLSPTDTVVFRAPSIPAEDEYRQIAEKFAAGTIDYRVASSTALETFAVGGKMPALHERPVRAADTSRGATVPSAIIVLLAASCSSCELHEYEAELVALNSRLASRGQGDRLSVVFDETFEEAAINAYLRSGHAARHVYRADLRGLVANRYDTRLLDLAKPLVVTLTAAGTIGTTAPLRLF